MFEVLANVLAAIAAMAMVAGKVEAAGEIALPMPFAVAKN